MQGGVPYLLASIRKPCNLCGVLKSLDDFYGHSLARDKHQTRCKSCVKLRSINFQKRHSDKHKEYNAKWYLNNKPKALFTNKIWHKKNYKRVLALNAMRRAELINATPKWLADEQKREMEEIYKTCPDGYHVDHIFPLTSKVLCGLHVPWNLQHLSAEENLRKNNFVIV